MKVDEGREIGREERWRVAKERSSERIEKREGASRAPKTIPMGMRRNKPSTYAYAEAMEGW